MQKSEKIHRRAESCLIFRYFSTQVPKAQEKTKSHYVLILCFSIYFAGMYNVLPICNVSRAVGTNSGQGEGGCGV